MDPWSELQASGAWVRCSTHNTTLQTTHDQLVFGRDMLLNFKFVAVRKTVRLRNRQMLIETKAKKIA